MRTAMLSLLLVVLPATTLAAQRVDTLRPVIVASKPFGESYVLAEMFAQLLEARGFAADRRPGLGATEVAFRALRSDAVDLYPEYTGTGLLAILGEPAASDPRIVFARVATAFADRYGIRWLPPLGFQNAFALAMRRDDATRRGIRTISDLARASSGLRAGFSADFIGRADGLPGLTRAYGLRFARVQPLLQAVKYRALAAGEVDVIDGYSTDGLIARYDLIVLADDRGFFPPYEAAALVGARLQRESPRAVLALTELSGRISDSAMRELNRRVEVDGAPIPEVARDALRRLGLVGDTSEARPVHVQRETSLLAYLWRDRRATLQRTGRHVLLTVMSLLAAIAVGLPLGLILERSRRSAEGIIRGVGVLQTLPGLALLAFMIPILGIGVLPALVALFLYSLYPILRNTYSGVRDADPEAVSAAEALGMTSPQVLRFVRLPLAAPIIVAGIRTAAVINVGTATLAAFIGAGGLGEPIMAGLALSDTPMILSGAIPAALLALLVDAGLGVAEHAVGRRDTIR